MRLHDGEKLYIRKMGSRVVGQRFVEICLGPEEILEAIEEKGIDTVLKYLVRLTKTYKRND